MSERNEFEAALQKAMRRVEAPPALLEYVMAAVEMRADQRLPRSAQRHKWMGMRPQWPAFGAPAGWWSGAMAATLVAGLFVGEQVHHHHQQELADRQFLIAVRVTDHALDQTRAQLLRAGINLAN